MASADNIRESGAAESSASWISENPRIAAEITTLLRIVVVLVYNGRMSVYAQFGPIRTLFLKLPHTVSSLNRLNQRNPFRFGLRYGGCIKFLSSPRFLNESDPRRLLTKSAFQTAE